jgi:hypothetical protein
MELSDEQLEKIRTAARSVRYGFVTINITAASNKLDLTVQHRVRKEEPKKKKITIQPPNMRLP